MYANPLIRRIRRRSDVMEDATVREFSGGLNVVDNDLNLDTRFAVILDNMSREEDGSMGGRWGTQLFSDLKEAPVSMQPADYIVNHRYFQDSTVVVLSDGRLARVLADSTATVIWDDTIADGLAGSPDGWGATDFASFDVFDGDLIVCNGTDKPLIIDFDEMVPVQYLADLATGTNVNVPICRYVLAANKYVLMAGDPLFPGRVHISSQNTSGTWFGDDPPNDGTFIDLGKVGVQGEQTITGINRYRDQVVIGFLSASVLGRLGIYDDAGNHVPDFNDVIQGFGCHSHRCMSNLGNDLFMLDDQGVTSIARSLYSGATEPKRVSELIDPLINRNVTRLVEADTILGAHAVYNSNDKQYMVFLPNQSEYARPMTEDPFEILPDRPNALRVYIPKHNMLVGDVFTVTGVTDWNDVDADAQLNGIEHTVTRVFDGNIVEIEPDGIATDANKAILGGGAVAEWTPKWTETIGYIYTFINELRVRAWARFRHWRWRSSASTELGNIIFADDTRLFLLGNQNNPLHSDFIGTEDEAPIRMVWEWPWADFDRRVEIKENKYVMLDVRGTAKFTMMTFIDLLYEIDGVRIPYISQEFVGGGRGGFGRGTQPYGGGRRTRDRRLYAWPVKGKLFKKRFELETTRPIRFIALSFLYLSGSIRG